MLAGGGDELVMNIIPKGIIMNNIAFSQALRLLSIEDSTVISRRIVFLYNWTPGIYV